ncbi:disabled-like protein 1-like [Huso huso]|uniref:Disabled-like protein 1-like n=1 Tax=Huso huso TaxID=61971 RepID=A0ABR0Y4U5_HUSHU
MSAEPQQSPVLDGLCQTQLPVKTRRPSKKGFVKTAEYLTARFQGEGVRYKAKLIGIDTVPEAQGDKMCLDSMMKLKVNRNSLGLCSELISRTPTGNGSLSHTHPNEHISFIKKDETDPRAFAYVFAQDGTYTLLSIKTANSADPVVEDLRDVCQIAAKLNEVRCVCSIGKSLRFGTGLLLLTTANPTGKASGALKQTPAELALVLQRPAAHIRCGAPGCKEGTGWGSEDTADLQFSCWGGMAAVRDCNWTFSIGEKIVGKIIAHVFMSNADCLLLDEEVTQVQTGIDEIDLFNPLPSSADSDTNKASPSSELSSLFPPSSPFTLPQAQPLPGSPVSPLELYHTGTYQPVWAAQMASSFNHLSQVQPAPFGQPTATAWIQQAPFGTPNPSQLGPWGAQASPTQPAPWGGPGPASPTQPGPWGAPASPTQPDPWGATASPTQLTPREASGPLSQPGAVPPVPGVWAQSAPTQPGQRSRASPLSAHPRKPPSRSCGRPLLAPVCWRRTPMQPCAYSVQNQAQTYDDFQHS